MTPKTIWAPTEADIERAQITSYRRWLERERGLRFDTYQDLWRWSVTDLDAFWSSIWDHFGIRASRKYDRVLGSRAMPGAEWFPGARLNYAEHALLRRDGHAALIARSETRGEALTTLTYAELADEVARVRAGLLRLGVKAGDRVVAYMPNIPETAVALLASSSIGAVWASCSPDFGTRAVVDRFQQLEPTVLLAVDGYRYGGRDFDRMGEIDAIERDLPTLKRTVLLPYLRAERDAGGRMPWSDLRSTSAPLEFAQLPFEHPLWVLYSSGTTGLPKGLVHSQGGILLEHVKSLALHTDVGENDRFFWFTTTGWMMWNYLLGILLRGGTALLFDGSPARPDMRTLWRFAADAAMTYFGTSAPFIHACMKADIDIGASGLTALRGVGSTGAPLSPDGFEWVVKAMGRPIPVGSMSGGTDLCTAFVQACPILPVVSGRLQCMGLGAKVESYSEDGRALIGEVGELVITEPMPSMPVRLWSDPDGSRYRASYFDVFPGVWRHGDWIEIGPDGSSVIYGRSDATLNRGGVRMGTAEFYRVVEDLPEVADSLVVELPRKGEESELVLFVVLAPGATLDDALRAKIASALRRQLSPRHSPDRVVAVPAIPKTLNGKKMEIPVKRLLTGASLEKAASEGAMADPRAITALVDAFRASEAAAARR